MTSDAREGAIAALNAADECEAGHDAIRCIQTYGDERFEAGRAALQAENERLVAERDRLSKRIHADTLPRDHVVQLIAEKDRAIDRERAKFEAARAENEQLRGRIAEFECTDEAIRDVCRAMTDELAALGVDVTTLLDRVRAKLQFTTPPASPEPFERARLEAKTRLDQEAIRAAYPFEPEGSEPASQEPRCGCYDRRAPGHTCNAGEPTESEES